MVYWLKQSGRVGVLYLEPTEEAAGLIIVIVVRPAIRPLVRLYKRGVQRVNYIINQS